MSELEPVEILLAEDSYTDAEMTIRALKKQGLANRVTWVKDGAEALDFVFRQGAYATRPDAQPKLVLLDLKMPKVDGIEVLRRLKQDARTALIPVVMLTSSAEDSDMVRSYQLGVNSYLVKPVEFDRFVEEVSKAGCYWAIMNKVPVR
jgi:CheY-like chemotaxis protein